MDRVRLNFLFNKESNPPFKGVFFLKNIQRTIKRSKIFAKREYFDINLNKFSLRFINLKNGANYRNVKKISHSKHNISVKKPNSKLFLKIKSIYSNDKIISLKIF